MEDLLNHYSNYFAGRCNLTLEPYDHGYRPTVGGAGWFDPNPVYLIHPQRHSPEMLQSGLKGDRVQLEMQLKRVLGRLEMAMGSNSIGDRRREMEQWHQTMTIWKVMNSGVAAY
ncbi:hypothetical protein NON20_15775 [Synechocystis sp. B12]|nr:hypothetical protein NON20_15775 [Synechocystis sp. B12]